MRHRNTSSPEAQTITQQLMAAQLGIYRAEWDLEADMHADKQAAVRLMVKNQMMFHQLCASPEVKQATTGNKSLELRRLHAHAADVSLSAIETTAGAALRGLQAWHAARAHNDFKVLIEPFRNLIQLQKDIARSRAKNLGVLYGRTVTPYEALIDAYDPGRQLDFIHSSFKSIAALCQDILQRKASDTAARRLAYPIDQQATICRNLIARMGYDTDEPRGHLSVSSHPFCRRVGRREVWLTNRYDPQDFLPALMNIIHEGGHGRYYQGLPLNLADDWMGGVAGETMNEGMALFAEQFIGRSPEFCNWLAPRIGFATNSNIDGDTLHGMLTHVHRDRLRTDAGEVVYPLHLLLRLAVEEALINDDLPVEELPAFWNQKSQELMGFTPASDNEGCLQDIQLFVGYIGYFPCYLLGFMVAAQVDAALRRALPTINADWAKGDFDRTNKWLHHNIYEHGRLLPADTLIAQATGTPLSPDALTAHLQSRYA